MSSFFHSAIHSVIISIILIVNLSNMESSFSDSTSSSSTTSCPGEGGKDSNDHCMAADKGQKLNCNLTPQSYEGPFFLPGQPIRADIREGRPGVPLQIQFTVRNTTCQPVHGAQVHIWHPDALGVYSAYSGYYPLGDANSKQITHPHSEPTEVATFLRGIQITNENGQATFMTIYPGWYRYRTLHLHFKITDATGKEDLYIGEVYFPDELTDQIAKVEPYKEHDGKRLKNHQDSQFLRDNGRYLLMSPKGSIEQGLEGKMKIIVLSE